MKSSQGEPQQSNFEPYSDNNKTSECIQPHLPSNHLLSSSSPIHQNIEIVHVQKQNPNSQMNEKENNETVKYKDKENDYKNKTKVFGAKHQFPAYIAVVKEDGLQVLESKKIKTNEELKLADKMGLENLNSEMKVSNQITSEALSKETNSLLNTTNLEKENFSTSLQKKRIIGSKKNPTPQFVIIEPNSTESMETVAKKEFGNEIEIPVKIVKPNEKEEFEEIENRKEIESKSRPKVIGKQTKICALFETIESEGQETEIIAKVHNSINATPSKSHFKEEKIQEHWTEHKTEEMFEQNLEEEKEQREEEKVQETSEKRVEEKEAVMDGRDDVERDNSELNQKPKKTEENNNIEERLNIQEEPNKEKTCEENDNPIVNSPATETINSKEKSRPKVIGSQIKVQAQIDSISKEECENGNNDNRKVEITQPEPESAIREQEKTLQNEENICENHKDSHHEDQAHHKQNHHTHNNVDSKMENESSRQLSPEIEKENEGEEESCLVDDRNRNQEVEANMKDPPKEEKLEIPPVTSNTSLLIDPASISKDHHKHDQNNANSYAWPSHPKFNFTSNIKIESSLEQSHPNQSFEAFNLAEKHKENNSHDEKGKSFNDPENRGENFESLDDQKRTEEVQEHLGTSNELKSIEKMSEEKSKVDFEKENLDTKEISEPNGSMNLFETKKEKLFGVASGEDECEENEVEINEKEELRNEKSNEKVNKVKNSSKLLEKDNLSPESEVSRNKINTKTKPLEKTHQEMIQKQTKISDKPKNGEHPEKNKIQKVLTKEIERTAENKIGSNKHIEESENLFTKGLCLDFVPTNGKETNLSQNKKLNDKKSITETHKSKLQQLTLPKRGPLSEAKGSFKSLSKKESNECCYDGKLIGEKKSDNKIGSSKSIEVKREESHEAIKYPEIGKNKSLNMSKTVEIKKIGYSQFKESRNKKVTQEENSIYNKVALSESKVSHSKENELSKSVLIHQELRQEHESPKSPFRVMEKNSIKKINFSSPYLEPVFRKSVLHNSRKAIGKGRGVEDRGDLSDERHLNEKREEKNGNNIWNKREIEENEFEKLANMQQLYGQENRRAKTYSKNKHKKLGLYHEHTNDKIETDSEEEVIKKAHKYLKAHSHQFSFLYPSTVLNERGEKLNKRLGELDKKLKRDHSEKKEDEDEHEYLAFYSKKVHESPK